MLSQRSSTTVCQECGKRNPASARFCTACAARLGAEPSIGAAAVPGATIASPDGPHDAPRTVDSRPGELPARAADSGAIWVKLCIGGLVLMLAFIAWALYMLTGSKVPAQVPTGQGAAASEVAPVAPPPPAPPPPPVATAPSAAPAVAPSATPAATSTVVPPSDVFPYTPPARAGVAPQRRPARGPQAPVDGVDDARMAAPGAWVEPSRAPAMTASPAYRDDGPPIVPGPGPSVNEAAPAAAGGTARPADPGPPVVDGPGPRYDFSTPGARGR